MNPKKKNIIHSTILIMVGVIYGFVFGVIKYKYVEISLVIKVAILGLLLVGTVIIINKLFDKNN